MKLSNLINDSMWVGKISCREEVKNCGREREKIKKEKCIRREGKGKEGEKQQRINFPVSSSTGARARTNTRAADTTALLTADFYCCQSVQLPLEIASGNSEKRWPLTEILRNMEKFQFFFFLSTSHFETKSTEGEWNLPHFLCLYVPEPFQNPPFFFFHLRI